MDEEIHLPISYDYFFCSNQIASMVNDSISDKSDAKRRELVRWINGTEKGSVLLGWLFEGQSREILTAGGDFKLRSLSDSHKDMDLHLAPNAYHHAETSNYESMDGYYYSEHERVLYLFQVTLNYNHPVKQSGIIKHLKSMDQTEKWSAENIRLVFVVCKDMDSFKRQEISGQQSDGMDSHVSQIPGIGPKYTNKLRNENIETAAQLKDAIDSGNPAVQRYRNTLNTFRAQCEDAKEWQFILSIPQYLVVLNVDYK